MEISDRHGLGNRGHKETGAREIGKRKCSEGAGDAFFLLYQVRQSQRLMLGKGRF